MKVEKTSFILCGLLAFTGGTSHALTLDELQCVDKRKPTILSGDGFTRQTRAYALAPNARNRDKQSFTLVNSSAGLLSLTKNSRKYVVGETVTVALTDGRQSSNSVFPTVHVCGDGVVTNSCEQCDDGNAADGDGCSVKCTIESQCSNGVDDDGDGKVDFPADPGCANSEDNSEDEMFDPCKITDADVGPDHPERIVYYPHSVDIKYGTKGLGLYKRQTDDLLKAIGPDKVVADFGATGTIQIDGVDGITLENCVGHAGGSHGKTDTGNFYALHLLNSSNLTVRRCHFHGARSSVVLLSGGGHTFEHCDIDDSNADLFKGLWGSVVRNSRLREQGHCEPCDDYPENEKPHSDTFQNQGGAGAGNYLEGNLLFVPYSGRAYPWLASYFENVLEGGFYSHAVWQRDVPVERTLHNNCIIGNGVIFNGDSGVGGHTIMTNNKFGLNSTVTDTLYPNGNTPEESSGNVFYLNWAEPDADPIYADGQYCEKNRVYPCETNNDCYAPLGDTVNNPNVRHAYCIHSGTCSNDGKSCNDNGKKCTDGGTCNYTSGACKATDMVHCSKGSTGDSKCQALGLGNCNRSLNTN